jgi:N-acetyltransferase 10
MFFLYNFLVIQVTLEESIRYKQGDNVESWLTGLLCLDATLTPPLTSGCPPPDQCELYYINRDTLFSFHKGSEVFLHRIISLYVASHYKAMYFFYTNQMNIIIYILYLITEFSK